MEQVISKNVRDLCNNTTVDESLLIGCQGELLKDNMKDTINSKPTNLGKASEFYTLMKKRPDEDLPKLIKALRDSGNDKAAEILENHGSKQPSVVDGPTTVKTDAEPMEVGSGLEEPGPSDGSDPNETNSSVIKTFEAPPTPQVIQTYCNEGYRGALIINVRKNRAGAEFDEQALNDTLTSCGFFVRICQTLTFKGIQDTLEMFKKSFDKANSSERTGGVFVAIMSHGTGYDVFLTEDDQRMSIDSIIEEFNNKNCKDLEGVPKIFLINVCRGDKVDAPGVQTDFIKETDWKHSTEIDRHPTRPSWTDILICYASYDNHVAYRAPTEGTWFIQTFCKKVRENTGMDIRDILDLIAQEVSEMETEKGGKQSCPYKNVVFTKKFYLHYQLIENNLSDSH